MHFVQVPLYVGAFFLILFIAILAIGSLIGLAGVVVEGLRPAGKVRETKVATVPTMPAATSQVVATEAESETGAFVPVGAEYARC